VVGPVQAVIPVDVFVTGCPPEPQDILGGILRALGRAADRRRGRTADVAAGAFRT